MSDQNHTIKPAHEIGRAFFVMNQQPGRVKSDHGPLTPSEAEVMQTQSKITKSHADTYASMCKNGHRSLDAC